AMNDVGMLVRLEHEFERGPREKSKPLDVIMMPIKDAPVEKVMIRMWIDEKTFQPFHESKVYVAMDPLVVVWHPKITVRFRETPDTVVAHAIIFGQDDFDWIAANAKFPGQALHNIAEAADFCRRCAFGRDHYNEHGVRDCYISYKVTWLQGWVNVLNN